MAIVSVIEHWGNGTAIFVVHVGKNQTWRHSDFILVEWPGLLVYDVVLQFLCHLLPYCIYDYIDCYICSWHITRSYFVDWWKTVFDVHPRQVVDEWHAEYKVKMRIVRYQKHWTVEPFNIAVLNDSIIGYFK